MHGVNNNVKFTRLVSYEYYETQNQGRNSSIV
jgi:hypothetical protein